MGGHSSATPLIWIPGSSLCVPSSTHTTHSQLLSTVHRSWHSCALRTLAERTKKAVPFGLNDWMNQLNKRRHELVGEWVRELKWNDGVQPPGPTLGRKRCLGKCLHPRKRLSQSYLQLVKTSCRFDAWCYMLKWQQSAIYTMQIEEYRSLACKCIRS